MQRGDEDRVEVNPGYALGQLARALVTAETHEDPGTRRRAETRRAKWEAVLRGMASGALRIGSREPVADLPAWVTPDVVRGGFATGEAAAGGPLTDAERTMADELELPPSRAALFGWFLSEAGLTGLDDMLVGKRYRVHLPEEAALLVAAWLGRTGSTQAAVRLIHEIEPFSDRLRFSPEPSTEPIGDLNLVSRETVEEAHEALSRRRDNERVEAQREALRVWSPFADEMLSLFLDSVGDGYVAGRIDASWLARAAQLLGRYRELAAAHTRCSKHRRPKENLAIMLSAAEDLVAGGELTARRLGLLQHAVDSMVARRGAPGTERHAALRRLQAREAAVPAHARLARLVVSRLRPLRGDRGTAEVRELTRLVSPGEAAETGLPAGVAIPRSVQRIVERAHEGTIEELIDLGLVPSAEVLARLVPPIAAQVVAATYPEPALANLMAVHYLAFRRRRSLLLLDLEHQVAVDELPWVRAVVEYRREDVPANEAVLAMRRIGGLVLDGFPATILPNPLIRELDALARESGQPIPFVEELAADIFMGAFSAKFLSAAKLAAGLLRGSLYERYYGIDYDALLHIPPGKAPKGGGARRSKAFTELCRVRTGAPDDEWSVSANGMVIEQAQILTTHNLAAFAGPIGLAGKLADTWETYAGRSFDRTVTLVSRTQHNPRPLGTVKDAAYAWRQMIFYLSFAPAEALAGFVDARAGALAHLPPDPARKLAPAVRGLQWVARGGRFEDHDAPDDATRFLGWSATGHWMLATRRA